jgi:hypothetical protein
MLKCTFQMFGKYDRDQDQAFSPQEVVNFFSTCPRMPWGPEVYYQVPYLLRQMPLSRLLAFKG